MLSIVSVSGAGNSSLPDFEPCQAVSELAETQVQVHSLTAPTALQLQAKLQEVQPTIVYLCGVLDKGSTPEAAFVTPFRLTSDQDPNMYVEPSANDLARLFEGCNVSTVLLNAMCLESPAEALRSRGVMQSINWAPHMQLPGAIALHFAHAWFACLRNPTVNVCEAFAIACHVVQVQIAAISATDITYRNITPPTLRSDLEPELPSNASIAPPQVPELNGASGAGLSAVVPGYDTIRLLAPRAELALCVCGTTHAATAESLGYSGQALRALLAADVRAAMLIETAPVERHPEHLPADSVALRCVVQTVSGAITAVAIGGAPEALGNPEILMHALRQTLVADALSLQFRLPPPGVAMPDAVSQPWVGLGVATVTTLLSTSLWVVDVLRSLAANPSYRGLAALGVAAVGNSTVDSFNPTDQRIFGASVTLQTRQAHQLPPQTARTPMAVNANWGTPGLDPSMTIPPMNLGAMDMGASAAATARTDVAGPRPAHPPWVGTGRPPLEACSEVAFRNDLMAFLRSRGKKVDPATFPSAVLNGTTLDLFALYREVCKRGGFSMGNAINWKGQIFPQMRNWTASHRLTGVGNALKRHYQNFLVDYEECNPADVACIGDDGR